MAKKINRFIKIYPVYYSLSGGLLFFNIINTLFLTTVKGLSASEFSLLTTISITTSILLQVPLLKVIKKIGNTFSVRLGNFIFIFSALLLTFSTTLFGLAIGEILYEVSFMFKAMVVVELRRNLVYANRENSFIKIFNTACMLYAIVGTIAGLVVGPLFNINAYLPMYIAIFSTLISFVLSFNLFDVSENVDVSIKEKVEKKSHKKVWSILLILLPLLYGLETGIVDIGQNQAKLFIQYELENGISQGIMATIFSVLVAFSNIPSIFSNIVFPSIYNKLKDKSGYLLEGILVSAFTLLLLGHLLPIPFTLKVVFMILGLLLIIMIRSPFRIYLQDVSLKNCPPEFEQDMMTYLTLSRNLAGAGLSAIATIILIYHTLSYVIFVLLFVSIAQLFILYKVNSMIKISKYDLTPKN